MHVYCSSFEGDRFKLNIYLVNISNKSATKQKRVFEFCLIDVSSAFWQLLFWQMFHFFVVHFVDHSHHFDYSLLSESLSKEF